MSEDVKVLHYLNGFMPGKHLAWEDVIPFDKPGFIVDVCTDFSRYCSQKFNISLPTKDIIAEYTRLSPKMTIDNSDDMKMEFDLFLKSIQNAILPHMNSLPTQELYDHAQVLIAEKSVVNKKRSYYNKKALDLVNSGDLQGFTPEHIFNMFSGRVKEEALQASGVSFKDFNNLYDYFEASRKVMQGQYFTPDLYAAWIMTALNPRPGMNVADLTCGKGVFFNYCPDGVNLFGNELDTDAFAIARFLYPDATITNQDFLYYGGPSHFYKKTDPIHPDLTDIVEVTNSEIVKPTKSKKTNPSQNDAPRFVSLDIVVGNPPFGLQWEKDGDSIKSHHYYLKRSADFMRPGGIMAVIVPETYLANPDMDKKMIADINALYNFECQIKLPDAAFKKVSVKNYGTKLMIFRRQHEKILQKPYLPEHAKEFLEVPFTPETARDLFNYLIAPIYRENERLHSHAILSDKDKAEVRFYEQYKKYVSQLSILFSKGIALYNQYQKYYDHDRECPPSLQQKEWRGVCKKIQKGLYFAEKKKIAEGFYAKYRDQIKPAHLTEDEWARVRIKRGQVLSYVKRLVRDQQKEERPELKMVKSKYHVYWKGYSPEMRKKAKELNESIGDTSIIAWVLNGDLKTISDPGMRRYLEKRRRSYEFYKQPLRYREQDANIEAFFKDWKLHSDKRNRDVIPNKRQTEDINRFCQVQYGACNWYMGTGKTLAGIAISQYKMNKKNRDFTLIVAPSIAINGTWAPTLRDYGLPYVQITSKRDIKAIPHGGYGVITLEILPRFKRELKEYLKHNPSHVVLIDEGDSISSRTSIRRKALFDACGKSPEKFILTGTMTRNTAAELYSLAQFLYNNSINMLDRCSYRYFYDKDGVLAKTSNDNYMKPFNYKSGSRLFKEGHAPENKTVFGVFKITQSVYNQEALQEFIEQMVVTRTFQEVAGISLYNPIIHTVPQNAPEMALNVKIREDFHAIVHHYFNELDGRKDTMMQIIRQMKLMQRAASTPHEFNEYRSLEIPSKFLAVAREIRKNADLVLVGTMSILAARDYRDFLQEQFPNRPVFYITGSDVTTSVARQAILDTFQASGNGILVATQQSLQTSINIPACNTVFIESLPWNYNRVSQFASRCMRADRAIENAQARDAGLPEPYVIKPVNVHYFIQENSIEQQIFKLIADKEGANDFIRSFKTSGMSDFLQDHDINIDDFFATALARVVDENGISKIEVVQGKPSEHLGKEVLSEENAKIRFDTRNTDHLDEHRERNIDEDSVVAIADSGFSVIEGEIAKIATEDPLEYN